ncbi:MAG TPA: DUF3971 domain-containing protein, partial [Gammaproteobacteria bacterium]|nr:DUF3971 domain-containing protein [Gammaproteobacteria bacterium]
MWPLLRKLVKRTLAVAAVLVIVVALGVGGFRLLVTQLPSYQTELQAWVNDSLGLRLEFDRLDARWGLRGPELTFHEARVAADDRTAPFLTARVASVGLSPLGLLASLVAQRELRIDRLTFVGIELALVQDADGALRLQGAPASAAERANLALDVPPDVEVIVRDSRVLYLDQSRNRAWDFQDVVASMNRDSGTLVLEARARPPIELGSRIELTAQGVIEGGSGADARLTGDWRVFANIRDVDLAVAARVLPATATVVPQEGNGDVSVWLEWEASALMRGTAELALDNVVLPRVLGTAGSRYERIALTSEWEQNADGWRLVLNDIAVARSGRIWPTGASIEIELENDATGPASFSLRSDFLRLEDLTPFFSPLPDSRLLQSWFALAPRGDLRDAALTLARSPEGWDYTVAAAFADFGVAPLDEHPGFSALTGEVRADSRSGRIDFRSRNAALDWPSVFRNPLDLEQLTGIVVWRQGQDAVRVVSDDLVLSSSDGTTRSNLELTLPLDGSSPRLDLTTRFSDFDASAVKRYLPVHKMPASVVDWADRAIRAGRVHDAQLTFVGPLQSFPFDAGEGEFHATAEVEQGELAFIRDWPVAQDLNGTIEFVNAGFSARGSGRVLGNRTADVRAGIADMRNPVLTLQTRTIGPLDQVLAFLQRAPLIAAHLGPDFARLQAPFGTGEVSVDLSLPLRNRPAYSLSGSLDIIDGELAVTGFAPHATEINGALMLRDGALTGERIDAIFLDGPVIANVVTPELPGYRARLDLEGEATIDAAASAFNLPFRDLLAGQTRWQGSLLIPAHNVEPRAPARITIGSNLSGVALRFPAPFAKAPAEPTNLQLELEFASGGGLDAQGYLGATRRFALQFDAGGQPAEGYVFRRGALRFGGA